MSIVSESANLNEFDIQEQPNNTNAEINNNQDNSNQNSENKTIQDNKENNISAKQEDLQE